MSRPVQHEQRFHIRSYEVEPDGRLRIVVLARMLQETAWQHASLLGKGFAERESGALFWVLSRLRVRIDRYPRWGDDFTIRTWPAGTDRILAVRDFELLDGDGLMGRATSGWLVVDGTSGRPIRPERLVGDLAVSPSEFPGSLERVRALPGLPDNPPAGEERAVQHHDIDQYRHVNNAAYLEWMVDAIAEVRRGPTGGLLELGTVGEISIDFIKELTVGERYQTRVSATATTDAGHSVTCEVLRQADGENICRALIIWKPAS